MAKAKKVNSHLPLVITGYILFGLLVLAVTQFTIVPFGRLLFTPGVLYFNVIAITISLAVGALLPAGLGYIIGGHSVKSKSKLSHHFNGILFGLLAYWIMTVFSSYVFIPLDYLKADPIARILLMNILPSISVAIIGAILAVAHVRSRQASRDVIEFKPFIAVLISAIILLPAGSIVNNMTAQSLGWLSFVPLALIVGLGALSYASLLNGKLSKFNRTAWSAVSVSVAFVSVFALSDAAYWVSYYIKQDATMEFQAIVRAIGLMLGLIAWSIYWRIQVKSLRTK